MVLICLKFHFLTDQAVSAFQARNSDIFPTKSCLILKIREVRQKVHQNTPNTPGVPSSPNPAAAAASHGASVHPQLSHNNHNSKWRY